MTDQDTSSDDRESMLSKLSRRRVLRDTGLVAGLSITGGAVVAQQSGGGSDDQAQFFEDGPDIALERAVGGLTVPTHFGDADEERDRWFVTDQTGQAYYVEDGEKTQFIDVQDQMVELGNIYGQYPKEKPGLQYDERGLLGIEFHPEFEENGLFYLRYSAPPDDQLPEGWDHYNILAEFEADDGLNSASLDSERQLLRIPHPQMNHNAGPITFGPDGYLYITMGDGGGANDDYYGHVEDWYAFNAGGNAQDVEENLLGNILRIDVDGGTPDADPVQTGTSGDAERPYGIPEDNPLVGTDGMDEIYAWGFRNPYGISFDSNGNLYAPDAGQTLYEEVNVVLRGGNYGWNLKEGTHCFDAGNNDQPPSQCPAFAPSKTGDGVEPLIDPVVEWPHQYRGNVVGAVVTSAQLYEGDAIPELQDSLVYSIPAQTPFQGQDPVAGRILTATPPGGEVGEVSIEDLAPGFPSDAEVPGEFTATGSQEASESDEIPPELLDTENAKNEIPRDQLWDMAQTNLVGTEDGTPNQSIRYVGQDSDGELYALTAEVPIPKGETGEVYKIVPPEEGDTPTETPADEAE